MSADLPTEEDVLAHLVLYAARPVVLNCYSSEQWKERQAWNAAIADLDLPGNAASTVARKRLDAIGDLDAAIADSERRLEVERMQRAVVAAAEHAVDGRFSFSKRMGWLRAAVADWHRARHALALAEVSRHGG